MSWKSTIRSLEAARRRSERGAKRRQRELERQEKELAKMQELERAGYEVEVYENYLDVLMSIHKDCGPEWDWVQVSQSSPPSEPIQATDNELKTKKKFEEYQPSILDKLLHRADSKRGALEAAINEAIQKDEEAYQVALIEYKKALSEAEEQRDLAKRILSSDTQAYIDAITKINPFSEISNLGSSQRFSCNDPKLIETTLYSHGDNVIPKASKSVLKSGRLSVKDMSKGKYYELYQDYVCGCVLRVARELFVLLPIETTIITSEASLLNTKTGHMEDLPILSVAIPRKTLEGLNFENLDPSDSLSNFVHNMNFRKTKGFAAVDRILPSSLQ